MNGERQSGSDPTPALVTLPPADWTAALVRHQQRVRPLVAAHLHRRQRGERHPVADFLFDYYRFRPVQLLRWSPGWGVLLAGPGAERFLEQPEYARRDDGVMLDLARFPRPRLESARWIRDLLRATRARAPHWGCFGIHEWAMVYESTTRRHEQLPLRVAPAVINQLVRSQPVSCTHFDAYRFFTAAARPLNAVALTRSRQLEQEQPGCLHANMDLYKWATKFYPWIGSDLIADAFLLAVEIRQLDMQASPYDVRAYGLEPVCVETPEGRARYRMEQQRLAEQAARLRDRLLNAYDGLLEATADHEC